jgi:hypothetical protein
MTNRALQHFIETHLVLYQGRLVDTTKPVGVVVPLRKGGRTSVVGPAGHRRMEVDLLEFEPRVETLRYRLCCSEGTVTLFRSVLDRTAERNRTTVAVGYEALERFTVLGRLGRKTLDAMDFELLL